MSASPDPFELLRDVAPRIDRDAPATDAENALLERILHALDGQPQRRRPRWRRRRRVFGGLVGVAMLGAASVGAAVWHELSRPDQPVTVTCWRDVARSGQWETRIGPGDSPTDACAPAWRDGTFGTDGPPPLVACTSSEGIIAVIPGESLDACAALGLPALDPGHATSPEVAEADLLQRLLSDPLNEICATEEETLALIDDVLSSNGIGGWTITRSAAFTPDRPCGQVAIDAATRTLNVLSLRQR